MTREDRLDRLDRRVAFLYWLAVGRVLWGAVGLLAAGRLVWGAVGLLALAYLIVTR